jgi:hypothetical protein
MGRFEDPLVAPNPRARKVYDNAKWTGYEAVLDVWEDVFAWGILLVPKDIVRVNGVRWWCANAAETACQREVIEGGENHSLRSTQPGPRRRLLPLAEPQG